MQFLILSALFKQEQKRKWNSSAFQGMITLRYSRMIHPLLAPIVFLWKHSRQGFQSRQCSPCLLGMVEAGLKAIGGVCHDDGFESAC